MPKQIDMKHGQARPSPNAPLLLFSSARLTVHLARGTNGPGLPAWLWRGTVIFECEKVQRHAPLVLGNVCQTDAHRATAGVEGAVEGLFALCDNSDSVVRANALWALGNLAWDPNNQVTTSNSLAVHPSAVEACCNPDTSWTIWNLRL